MRYLVFDARKVPLAAALCLVATSSPNASAQPCLYPTKAVYLNGISTTQTGAIRDVLTLRDMARSNASLPATLTWTYYYNQAHYIFDQSCATLSDKCGLSILDLFEVLAQVIDEGDAWRGRYELVWYFLEGGDPNLAPSWIQRIGGLTMAMDSYGSLMGSLDTSYGGFLNRRTDAFAELFLDPSLDTQLVSARERVTTTVKHISDDLSADLKSGYNIALIPHSQGNLYANEVYDGVQKSAQFVDFPQRVSVIHVAVPSSSRRGPYVTANQDKVIDALRVIFPTILPGNTDVTSGDGYRHFFVNTYLNNVGTRDFIINTLSSSVSTLGTHAPDCSNLACQSSCANLCPHAIDCSGLECGPDRNCQVSCGVCNVGYTCESGLCVGESSLACPHGNGMYCGDGTAGRDRSILYDCQNGVYTVSNTCGGLGCHVNVAGTSDSCNVNGSGGATNTNSTIPSGGATITISLGGTSATGGTSYRNATGGAPMTTGSGGVSGLGGTLGTGGTTSPPCICSSTSPQYQTCGSFGVQQCTGCNWGPCLEPDLPIYRFLHPAPDLAHFYKEDPSVPSGFTSDGLAGPVFRVFSSNTGIPYLSQLGICSRNASADYVLTLVQGTEYQSLSGVFTCTAKSWWVLNIGETRFPGFASIPECLRGHRIGDDDHLFTLNPQELTGLTQESSGFRIWAP